MTKILKPINDQVILKPLSQEEQSYGNIIIPDIGNEKPVLATVLKTSEGIYNYHTDRIIPHQVKPGDVVAIPKLGAQVITIEGQEYFVCQANQLLAIIEDEEIK